MKKVFSFWLIIGVIASIITVIYQGGVVDWSLRSIVGMYAGGLLWTFPIVVIYGWVDYIRTQRKQNQSR